MSLPIISSQCSLCSSSESINSVNITKAACSSLCPVFPLKNVRFQLTCTTRTTTLLFAHSPSVSGLFYCEERCGSRSSEWDYFLVLSIKKVKSYPSNFSCRFLLSSSLSIALFFHHHVFTPFTKGRLKMKALQLYTHVS